MKINITNVNSTLFAKENPAKASKSATLLLLLLTAFLLALADNASAQTTQPTTPQLRPACVGENVPLTANTGNNGNNYLMWRFSDNNQISWTDIADQISVTYTIKVDVNTYGERIYQAIYSNNGKTWFIVPNSTYKLIVNSLPTAISDVNNAVNSIPENAANGTSVGIKAQSSDPEGKPIIYSLINNAGGRFRINDYGDVLVADGTKLDYETAKSHLITVQASDGACTITQNFTIAVTNVHEAPVAINVTHSPAIVSTADAILLTLLEGRDDEDATLTYFRIINLPATGILIVNNKAVNAETSYPWSLRNTLKYDPVDSHPTGNVTFAYRVVDDLNLESISAATYTIPVTYNARPVADNIVSNPIPGKNVASPISPLRANDAGGAIANYTILTVPDAAKGSLELNGVIIAPGRVISSAQVAQMSFKPSFKHQEDITFTYTATDDLGAVAATPATYTIPVKLDVDIALTSAILPGAPYYQGNKVTIRITATNVGSSPLYNGALVQDLLPNGLTYLSNTAPIGQYSSADDTWKPNEGGIAAGASYFIDITARIDVAGVITHTANVISAPYIDFNTTNNTTTYSLTSGANLAPVAKDINMTFIPNKPVAWLINPLDAIDTDGTIASYTIEELPGSWLGVLELIGTPVIKGQVLTPAQATQLSFRPTISYEGGVTFTYSATDNRGVISAANATYKIPVTNYVDLELKSEIVGEPKQKVGEEVTIKFTVTNKGTAGVNGAIQVPNILAAGLEFVSSTASSIVSDANNYIPGTNTWTASNYYLAPGASVTFSIVAKFKQAGIIEQSLTVEAPIGIIDIDKLNNTAAYAFGEIIPLPVTLVRFTAAARQNAVSLNWETATEKDNDYFVLERSLDGKAFREIGRVKGAGNSSQKLIYTYLDKQAPASMVYYRLKQVDFSGKYAYSHIVTAELTQPATASVVLYPNPATAYVKLNIAGLPAAAYQVRLLSIDGRLLQTFETKADTELEINVQALATGKYILQIQSETVSKTLSFIKR